VKNRFHKLCRFKYNLRGHYAWETPDVVTPASVGATGTLPEEEEEPAEDVIEIDEWLLTFAALFRKHLGAALQACSFTHSIKTCVETASAAWFQRLKL